LGIGLSRQTLANWMLYGAKNCIFRPKSSTDSGTIRPPIPIELVH